MLDKYIDNDDPVKVRRSMLTVALLTVFLANIRFTANELSILGLKVMIDPERLVALGRISSVILLMVFALRSLPQIVKAAEEYSQRSLAQKEKAERSNIFEDRYGPDVPDPPPHNHEDIDGMLDWIKRSFDLDRKYISRKFSQYSFIASMIAVVLLDYTLPVGTAIVAGFFPYALSDLVDCIARSSSPASL